MLFSAEDRIIKEGRYVVGNNATIRSTAKQFGLSKSSVHKDLNKKLKDIDFELYSEVKLVLCKNFKEKHLRGGQATKLKYSKSNKQHEA